MAAGATDDATASGITGPADGPVRGIVAVVLAGGRSSRMGGGDKGLAELAGKPLLAHVVDRIAPQVDAVILNANGDPARFGFLGLPVVPDATPDHPGPLAGMLAGLTVAAGMAPPSPPHAAFATSPSHVAFATYPSHVAFAPADTPFLPPDLVARLAAALPDDRSIAMPVSSSGTQQVACLVPVALAGDLAAHLAGGGRRAVMAWLERHPILEVPFGGEAGVDPFFNVNTPEDLEIARAALPRSLSGRGWPTAG